MLEGLRLFVSHESFKSHSSTSRKPGTTEISVTNQTLDIIPISSPSDITPLLRSSLMVRLFFTNTSAAILIRIIPPLNSPYLSAPTIVDFILYTASGFTFVVTER
ncbi:hypothetical protein RYX36_019688 [Vicia faba]